MKRSIRVVISIVMLLVLIASISTSVFATGTIVVTEGRLVDMKLDNHWGFYPRWDFPYDEKNIISAVGSGIKATYSDFTKNNAGSPVPYASYTVPGYLAGNQNVDRATVGIGDTFGTYEGKGYDMVGVYWDSSKNKSGYGGGEVATFNVGEAGVRYKKYISLDI